MAGAGGGTEDFMRTNRILWTELGNAEEWVLDLFCSPGPSALLVVHTLLSLGGSASFHTRIQMHVSEGDVCSPHREAPGGPSWGVNGYMDGHLYRCPCSWGVCVSAGRGD